ncbi:Type 1 glutamine amidotransferase-like domain-containing protein [Candidatus Pacearchaeota archaeon]|nr:Type 1 glutamine amidotransferase-like domain-containing protein [Candidatus Pacearchaeota archaeon]
MRKLLANKKLKNELIKFLPKKPKNILVGHIPNAADPQKDKSYVQESINQLESMGMKIRKVDLREENRKSLKKKLSDCDLIFVNGGNTFYLLEIIRKSGFNKILPKLLDKGKIYLGASAGSYVACPTIEAAAWKHADRNINNLKDLTGLNFVPFIITAHFEEEVRKATEKGAKKAKFPVVALTDKQAVIVKGNKYKVVGKGKRRFYNGFKESR